VPTDITSTIEGQAIIDLELRVKNQTVPLIGPQVFFHSSKLIETVFGNATHTIILRTTNLAYVDNLLKAVMADGTPKIRFRIGQGSERTIWNPWQNHLLLDYSAKAEGLGETAGHVVRIVTADLLYLIDRASKTVSHRGLISRIVQNIASKSGLTDTVIEETSGDGIYIQSFEGDVQFIRQRLVKRARSQKGRGNYLFFVRDNVVHFHSPDYQAQIKTLNYYQTGADGLMQKDASQRKLEHGAAGVRMVAYDALTGQAKEIRSDPSKTVRYGNTTPLLRNIPGAERNLLYHLSANRPEEAEAVAQNTYEAAHHEIFELQLVLRKNPIIHAGDLLQININPGSAKVSTWSGFYLIVNAQHTVETGALKSVYTLMRGEQFSPGISRAQQGIGTVQDENAAPGEDLNLRETQNSLLTKGAGKLNADGVFLTVQDNNKAPTLLT
jgi:hypothetical protein